MLQRSIILTALSPIALSLSLAACGNGAAADPSKIKDNYVELRQHLAAGDIGSAAAMTTDPTTYVKKMEAAAQRMGADKFKAFSAESIKDIDVHSVETEGKFAVLILNTTYKGKPVKAGTFYRSAGSKMLESVGSTRQIPCTLISKLNKARGEPDNEFLPCTK